LNQGKTDPLDAEAAARAVLAGVARPATGELILSRLRWRPHLAHDDLESSSLSTKPG
jgi:hypothetical protein